MDKTCKQCGLSKKLSEFYLVKKDKPYFNSKCKTCVKWNNVQRYKDCPSYKQKRIERMNENRKNPEFIKKSKERSSSFYKSMKGRAMTLLKSAQRRKDKFQNSQFDLDLNFILSKLESGFCEVTGIKFDFEKHDTYVKNPFAPSIDRIDSSIGYIKSNVRIVIWQFNLMKGEISDNELRFICERVLKNG